MYRGLHLLHIYIFLIPFPYILDVEEEDTDNNLGVLSWLQYLLYIFSEIYSDI